MSPGTMTSARQQKKARRPFTASVLALAAVLAAFSPALAANELRIVADPNSGLALSGVDPVAYFTDGRPVFGRPDLELSTVGAVWRFRNAGNRTAFVENPDVYMPRFGGYDPVALMRGRSVPGHPLIWAIRAERLYLFYSDADRAAFLADPDRIIATAERRWPDVARTIGR